MGIGRGPKAGVLFAEYLNDTPSFILLVDTEALIEHLLCASSWSLLMDVVSH